MTAKLIFSDIDGTLINSDLEVTPKTRDAIRKQIIQGNIFAPVSARMPKAIMTAAGQVAKVVPMVAYNGALVLDELGRPIVTEFMKPETAMKVIQTLEDSDEKVTWNIYSGNDWYAENHDQFVANEEAHVKVKSTILPVDKIKDLRGVHKILVMGQANTLEQIMTKLDDEYPELASVKSAEHLLEITVKGVSKATGIKALADEFSIDLKDCYAFGDNFNDESMLAEVGHPFLMGNAPEELKAKFPVTADNDHDGIADVLDKVK